MPPIVPTAVPALVVQLAPPCCEDPHLRLALNDQVVRPGEEFEIVVDCEACQATCIDVARVAVSFVEA